MSNALRDPQEELRKEYDVRATRGESFTDDELETFSAAFMSTVSDEDWNDNVEPFIARHTVDGGDVPQREYHELIIAIAHDMS